MSRIGYQPLKIPEKVQANFKDNVLNIKGPNGEIRLEIPKEITYKQEDDTITFDRVNDEKSVKSLHGLTRSLVGNAVEGVTEGVKRRLKIEGVGFKAEMNGDRLVLSIGYSHPVLVIPPEGIKLAAPDATTIEVEGADKHLVGEMAAVIRKIRKPEPYKGKGIRYENEYIRRKAGKTAT